MKEYSIHDVARAAHVSPTTVSRVFNNHAYVSKEVQDAVLKVAREMGYSPKQYRKRLHADAQGMLVGIVVADLRNPFFLDLIESAQAVLRDSGIGTVICNSNESSQQEIFNLDQLKHRVNGIIISPVSEMVDYNIEFLKDMNATGTPIILFDRDLKGVGVDGVFQENYSGTMDAMECFIANGHEHIAIITGPISAKPGLDRLNAYVEALRQHHLPLRQEYIAYGDFKQESGYQLCRQLLETYKDITAVFCANNLMALGAMLAILDMGLRIPQDVALISYGVLSKQGTFHGTPITALEQPIEQMGEECARMMLEKLNGGKKRNRTVRRITFEANLVLLGSEKLPNRAMAADGHQA